MALNTYRTVGVPWPDIAGLYEAYFMLNSKVPGSWHTYRISKVSKPSDGKSDRSLAYYQHCKCHKLANLYCPYSHRTLWKNQMGNNEKIFKKERERESCHGGMCTFAKSEGLRNDAYDS
jgi:hypothetical protein